MGVGPLTVSGMRIVAPAMMRILVNDAASMSPSPNARRQSTEFAAKANMATTVKRAVRNRLPLFVMLHLILV